MSGPWFRCFLPTELDDVAATPGVVSRAVWIQTDAFAPREIAARATFTERFLAGVPIIWVEDEVTRFLTPFWVPRRWQAALRGGLAQGTADNLSQDWIRVLRWAGIVTDPTEASRDALVTNDQLSAAARELAERGFTNVRGLLHDGMLAALRAYYRALALQGARPIERGKRLQYGIHNEPLMQFVHHQLTATVAQVTGTAVIPSYCYFKGYREGAALEEHTDREQCELTVALLIDFEPIKTSSAAWPVWIRTPSGCVAVRQEPGDALFFRGIQHPHWRETLHTGHWSHSLLLHYVHETFAGRLR